MDTRLDFPKATAQSSAGFAKIVGSASTSCARVDLGVLYVVGSTFCLAAQLTTGREFRSSGSPPGPAPTYLRSFGGTAACLAKKPSRRCAWAVVQPAHATSLVYGPGRP